MKHNFSTFKWVSKIFSMLFFLAAFNLNAQQILLGKVTTGDNQTIAAAYIKNFSTKTGTVTNDSGAFRILVNKGDSIEIGKLGFESQLIIIDNQTELTVVLKSTESLLDEIVISASRGDQSLKNTSVSMEIIKPYLIDNKNPSTAENVVDQIPGVQAIDGQVVIRSGSGWSYGTGSRVMVMLDGMPMLSGDAGNVQWTFLPVENIENIEVIKGASSVLFGSSALNGIINIKTAKPKNKPETKLSTFYGFYNKASDDNLNWNGGKLLSVYGVRAFHAQKLNALNSLTVSLNGFKDEGYRMSDAEERVRLGIQYQRSIPKIKGKPVNASAGINGNIQTGKSSSFLLWENERLKYTALDSNITLSNSFKLNIDPYILIGNKKVTGLAHSLRGRYFRIGNEIEDNAAGSSNQSNYSNAWYGEYQVSKRFNPNLKVIAGITGNYAESQSPLYQGFQTSTNKAIYVQANPKVMNWNFDIGLRYESYQLNDYKEAKPVFRAGLSKQFGKATFIRASYGQGYRFPTIAESYVLTSVGPVKIYPNTNLKSEQGWNAEIGVKQGLKLGKLLAILDIAVFRMKYDRMMEFTFAQWETNSPTFGFGFKSLNVSDAQIQGIDISFSGGAKKKDFEVKWLAGYTFSHAIALNPDEVFYTDSLGRKLTFRNTSSNPTGNYLKYRPKHLARLDIQVDKKGWEIGLSGRYNSYLQNIDTAFVSFPISFAVPGVQKVREQGKKGDYIFDIRFGKTFTNWKILVIVNNVLNRQYMTRPCDMGAPRTFMLQINRTF